MVRVDAAIQEYLGDSNLVVIAGTIEMKVSHDVEGRIALFIARVHIGTVFDQVAHGIHPVVPDGFVELGLAVNIAGVDVHPVGFDQLRQSLSVTRVGPDQVMQKRIARMICSVNDLSRLNVLFGSHRIEVVAVDVFLEKLVHTGLAAGSCSLATL